MFVTRHSNIVEPTLVDKLWHLYEVCYEPISAEAPSHEMLYRSEFESALADPTNRSWVLWDDQTPIGMALVATDIAATRYLSREYFERHYPDHMANGLVHYAMWIVVHPRHVATGAIVRLCADGMALEASEGALLVFDAPFQNQPNDRGGMAELISRLAKRAGGPGSATLLGVARYYAYDFSATPDGSRPVESDVTMTTDGASASSATV